MRNGALLILHVLDKLPGIDTLVQIPDNDFDVFIYHIDPLLNPLLRWILRSSYARLTGDVQVSGINFGIHIRMENANIDNERIFQKQKALAIGREKTLFGFVSLPILIPKLAWFFVGELAFNTEKRIQHRQSYQCTSLWRWVLNVSSRAFNYALFL